jgi:hypothetical protein
LLVLLRGKKFPRKFPCEKCKVWGSNPRGDATIGS